MRNGGYPKDSKTVQEQLADVRRLIESTREKAMEQVAGERRRGPSLRDEVVHRACWLLAATADDVEYEFEGRYAELASTPVVLDEYVREEEPRRYDTEDELREAILEILRDLEGFHRELSEYVDEIDIEENTDSENEEFLFGQDYVEEVVDE